MRIKGFIFLMVNLAISTSFFENANGPENVVILKETDIPEANKGHRHDDIVESPSGERSAILGDYLWTSPVPYIFDQSLEINARGVILQAFDQFKLKSCIDFKPRDSEKYYVDVKKLDGCFSSIGRVTPNGQVLSIGQFCDSVATVEHEFLHALGFFHEQSRYDRDDYVIIQFENIVKGYENNFLKASSEESTTQGVPYDYFSVMHYGQNFFSNGNGSTIITKDPDFQNVIGQRLEMSSKDVLELNLLYKCNSSITFMMKCSFSEGSTCQTSRCSQSSNGWEMVTQAQGGPSSDHTGLPNGNGTISHQAGHFMHASTATGQQGDSAWLETNIMSPKRDCHVQCLHFYYFHSGNESDELNIWMREFQNEQDTTGTLYLMGQITGPPTSHWTLHHVSLNATKHFQVEFEVRKGAGRSSGGFSIDDINLSETECPHVTIQLNDFNINTPKVTYSPRQYSAEGYAYRILTSITKSNIVMFLQLVSGDYDDKLQWPCSYRQVTFQILDQNPNIQLQMSKRLSFTTAPTSLNGNGNLYWDNPRIIGTKITDEYNATMFVGPSYGYYVSVDMQTRDFIKGGSAIFLAQFKDISPLLNVSVLPCPEVRPPQIKNPSRNQNVGPCSQRGVPTTPASFTTSNNSVVPTTDAPPTTDDSIVPTTYAPPTTTDDSIFGFSPAVVASPVLILLALLLLMP
ncbi:meprin A subunit beta-like [Parambassis ranga]|uniref:Metalloendopeptidase n=1 Tax=Parambassis ranga TaxID=210632 RepID=A0A6P7JXT5_9TELE|nr:meprin A subunit beta-like [Parambassis ranga]